MKIISPLVLPHFHGNSTEDLDEFLFDFDILCRIYDYTSSEKKLKLFPSTLKDNALHWFMSLVGETVATWDNMKQVFLAKYQEYCITKDKREELFKMVQKEDEILEDLWTDFYIMCRDQAITLLEAMSSRSFCCEE